MPSLLQENPHYIDLTSSSPLVGGKVFIGTKGSNPSLGYPDTTDNLITIYSDRALTIPLANPQTIGSNGRTANKIWIPDQYALEVWDANDVQKLLDQDAGEAKDDVLTAATMTDLLATSTSAAQVDLQGFHAIGDGGGGSFYWDATANKNTHNGGTIIDPDNTADLAAWNAAAKTTWFTPGTGAGCWVLLGEPDGNSLRFGLKADGGDDILALNNAIAHYETVGIETTLPFGAITISTSPTITKSNTGLIGKGGGLLDSAATTDEAAATTLNYTGVAGPVIVIDDGINTNTLSTIKLKGFAIEGNETATEGIKATDLNLFLFDDINIKAVTNGCVQFDQSEGTALIATGFGECRNVNGFTRGHTGSVNAHGFILAGGGAATPAGISHITFTNCAMTLQNGHGWQADGKYCDAHTLIRCRHFRTASDTGSAINFTDTDAGGILNNWRTLGCAFEGAITVAAPSGITTNFLPTEDSDFSGVYPFELDGNLDDPRMGIGGNGRHLVRGRSSGFRAGLDRLWWGFESNESSNMRHLYNDLANSRVFCCDFGWGVTRIGAGTATTASRTGGGTELSTGAVLGDTIAIHNTSSIGANGISVDENPAVLFQVEPLDTTDVDLIVGFASQTSVPPTDGIYFLVNTAISNNWKAVTRSGGTETSFDTTLNIIAGLVTFGIIADANGVTFLYKPKNALRQSWRFLTHSTTNIPTSDMSTIVKIRNKAAADKRIDVLRYEMAEYLIDV